MSAAVFLYEAFAAKRFGGNMAGVVFLEAEAPSDWMQGVASDLAAPTTGFVDLTSARTGDAHVRFFTPRQEIDACGHVTVAIASALTDEGIWQTDTAESHAVTASGGRFPLALAREHPGQAVQVTMRQRLVELAVQTEAQVSDVLGKVDSDPALPVVLAGTGLRHLLVPVRTAGDLAAISVDADAILRVSREHRVDTIGVYSVAEQGDSDRLAVRMRDLCAGIGYAEEPASGTTSGALALALHRLGRAEPSALVEVTMGAEIGRPSRLNVTLDVTGPIAEARVTGTALRVLKGTLAVE